MNQNQKQKTNAGNLVEEEATVARNINSDYKEKFGFSDEYKNVDDLGEGIDEDKVRKISALKNEPEWMLERRLLAYNHFINSPTPQWGADLNKIDYNKIHYFVRATDKKGRTWNEVPAKIKETFERLGVPQAERKFLAGVASQYESEVIYHKLKDKWTDQGIIFEDTDTALKKYPDIFKKHFGTVIPYSDNKLAALNTAVWSGGTFIYVPKGVKVELPLQAYFRINAQNMGQFERTLIIVDEGAYVHYVEGCTAPTYSTDSLHSAVVEILVKENGRCRYSTIQNWSHNVYNLVTKRAQAFKNATMEWVDGNLGSKLTMKYPAVWLMDEGAHGEVLSIAFANKGQLQDAGGKIVHAAPDTSSVITSKSISKGGGRTTYRGLIKVAPNATNSKSNVLCDALILDDESSSDTFPYIEIENNDVSIGHEASVSKVSEEQLFYLMSRGIEEDTASNMIVSGFIEPIVKELPMEYALEMNRLIEMEMEGSVG